MGLKVLNAINKKEKESLLQGYGTKVLWAAQSIEQEGQNRSDWHIWARTPGNHWAKVIKKAESEAKIKYKPRIAEREKEVKTRSE